MEKAKQIGFIGGLMPVILAVVMVYPSAKGLLTIPSANSFEDSGTYTFEPYPLSLRPAESTEKGGVSRLHRGAVL